MPVHDSNNINFFVHQGQQTLDFFYISYQTKEKLTRLLELQDHKSELGT